MTTKPRRTQAHSASVPSHSGALAEPVTVVGRAVEFMRREESRRKMPLADGREGGRGGCGVQTTADTPGALSAARLT